MSTLSSSDDFVTSADHGFAETPFESPIELQQTTLSGLAASDAHAPSERREMMPLDAAYFYWRHLELKLQKPDLFKICNSINTIDLVLRDKMSWDRSIGKFSPAAWSKIREKLFNALLLNFAGKFVIYPGASTEATTQSWPTNGYIEFSPEKESRPRESYRQSLERLEPVVLQALKERFAEGKSKIKPAHFSTEQPKMPLEAIALLHRFYEVCEEEAEKGRATVHLLWVQLQNQSKTIVDRRGRKELQKRIQRLQSVWGPPAHRF